jgi:tyrosyl-tRNA synthetase
MFGKLMSISDDLMWRYFELLSFKSMSEIEGHKKDIEAGKNPRDVKFLLAEEIIARFHDVSSATRAREDFIARFAKGVTPDEMPELTIEGGAIGVAAMLKQAGLTASTSDSFRMIQQGAVKLDGVKVEDKTMTIEAGVVIVAQVGKRKFARISVK